MPPQSTATHDTQDDQIQYEGGKDPPTTMRSTSRPPSFTCHFVYVAIFFSFLAVLLQDITVTSIERSRVVASASVSPSNTVLSSSSSSTIASTLERGKRIEKLSASELHKAYRAVQQDYHEKAFGAATKQWKVLSQREGVKVSMMHHPTDPNCPYVQMTAVLDASVEDCWDFLSLARWEESMPRMDPFYEGVQIDQTYRYRGVSMTLVRKRTNRILAFGKRDFVFVSVADKPLRDGTWVSGTVSVVTDKFPRKKQYTRAFQDSVAFYKPIRKNRTELTIIFRIDLNDSGSGGSGGAIPMWVYVKTIGISALQSMLSMRKHVLSDKELKDQSRSQNK